MSDYAFNLYLKSCLHTAQINVETAEEEIRRLELSLQRARLDLDYQHDELLNITGSYQLYGEPAADARRARKFAAKPLDDKIDDFFSKLSARTADDGEDAA